MNKNLALIPSILLGLGAFFFLGCSKDDDTDPQEEIDSFYKNTVTDAETSDIIGTWAFFEVEFDGRKTAVPATYESCDRDYFNFGADGIYKEYVITDTGCAITELESKWNLQKGIIILSSFTADDQELVIVDLKTNELTVKTRFDSDEDGNLEIFALTARRYEPKDRDNSTDSFTEIRDEPLNDKIQFNWQPYAGQNTFSRYEIYRSAQGCDKSNAQLVTTITDSDQTYYFDENPPIVEQLCYFLRIYTDKGLSGESGLRDLPTQSLNVMPVEMLEPVVSDNSIEVMWKASESPYFSHYEIGIQNHDGGSGYGYREEVLGTVTDVATTTFIDAEPPYFKNPVYTVKVFDIFGNQNYDYSPTVQTSRTAIFKRPEVLEFNTLKSTEMDPENSVIYFFGAYRDDNQYSVQKYNYATKKVEAEATNSTLVYESNAMRLVNSPNGNEIVLAQSNALQVYAAQSLDYKYKLEVEPAWVIDDFAYLGNNFWAIVDQEEIFIYKRENSNFELIDQSLHYSSLSPYTNRQQLIVLPDRRILIARNEEANSILFTYDGQGKLNNKKTIVLSLNSDNRVKAQFNSARNHIIDYATNRIYSAADFSLIQSFEAPYFPSGTSTDGKYIFGSNNDIEFTLEGTLHEKRIISLDLDSRNLTSLETKGYPHLVFRNHLGQTVSISSGLKRAVLTYASPKPDIFVEIIEP